MMSETRSTQKKVVPPRFVFTIKRDIILLKACLQHNPWQLGNGQWKAIVTELEGLGWKVTLRSIKFHVNLLLQQFKNEQLTTKTGTEEEMSERGHLLTELDSVINLAETPINWHTDDEGGVSTNDPIIILQELVNNEEQESSQILSSQSKVQEKRQADQERDEILASATDTAPSPITLRVKRSKMTIEEELIKQRQEHDITIEKKKMELEECKMNQSFVLEKQKLDFQKASLELETKREDRLAEENKRRDNLASKQMEMQDNLLKVLLQLSSKKE